MQKAIDSTRVWIEKAVIELNLCPFAATPFIEDTINYICIETDEFDAVVESALTTIEGLADYREVRTTLLIFPNALSDFEEFLLAAGAVEQILEDSGADELLVLATFHPRYVFEGEEPILGLSNRSPHPMFHFIPTADFYAVEDHVAAEIVERNQSTISGLSDEQIANVWPHLT